MEVAKGNPIIRGFLLILTHKLPLLTYFNTKLPMKAGKLLHFNVDLREEEGFNT